MLELPLEVIVNRNFRELIEHPKLSANGRRLLLAMVEHDSQPFSFRIEWGDKTLSVSAGQIYAPVNYDAKYHGPVTARTALANSYNIPAVKLLDGLTVDRMLEGARVMGLRSLTRDREWYGLSLTLGGGEVTLLELTSAYTALASGGRSVEPDAILSMTDSLGRQVSEGERAEAVHVVSPAAAFLVSDILSDNNARGGVG